MKLYRLARTLEIKYFDKFAIDATTLNNQIAETIKVALANASTKTNFSGIMPFAQMIKEDNTGLSLIINKNNKTITVQALTLTKPELFNKYQSLSSQIETYLEKHWEVFPSLSNGDTIDYNNFTFEINYSAEQEGIAST